MGIFALVIPLFFMGCSGDDGAQGPQGIQGIQGPEGPAGPGVTTALNLESCAICHDDQNVRNGDAHQADYDQRFQDGVLVVVPGSIAYAFDGTNNNHIVTFQLTENGQPFNCTAITTGAPDDSLSIGFAVYNPATRTFDPPAALGTTRMSLGSQSTLTYDLATNVCTSTQPDNTAVNGVPTPTGDLSALNGIIEINGRNDRQGTLASPSRVQLALYPFAGLFEMTGGVDYVSAANVTGCEKCHTVPYLKHGFIYGRVAADPGTDFYTCKGCHMDNAPGGHFIWQLLVDNPQRAAELVALFEATPTTRDDESDFMTPAELTQYAYTTRLMNDVHMSHAMEFAYPQSMANCATCHDGKLTSVLTDANFTIETCKSCHPVNGGTDTADAEGDFTVDTRANPPEDVNKQAPALVGLIPLASIIPQHNPPFATACNACHNGSPTGIATVFSEIHTGYDKIIYGDAAGTKYSTAITVTIDNASFNNATKILTFGFHATGSLGGLSSANIIPTVLVGLYGYDSKDFIIGPHETSPAVPSGPGRYLEYEQGEPAHPRITLNTVAAGSWSVTANLSDWAGWIDNLTVRRVEVGVTPGLLNADNETVALNAPSRTFNIVTNAFEDNFFGNSIVKVPASATGAALVSGCNNCHDALATTFHTNDKGRGGNIVICRMCHITKAAGSHLELQSRSIDSYAHAIHRFQAFDTGGIDFDDPVEALHYQHHVQSNFPTFGVENCRACHNAAKFNVPSQSLSLPGVLSDPDFNTVRNIAESSNNLATGPATRACGACHRAEAIIANLGFGDAAKLANINSHMTTFGYMIPTDESATTADKPSIMQVISDIFLNFADATVLASP
jgi:OmcA/MtrC family decaheme c-type cytochrome